MDHLSEKRPTLRALFLGFSSVGLSGFGGVLPFARRMLVEEKCWMTAEEFNTQLGLCQFLPGPNVVNLAVLVGKRYQGWRGAFLAPLGLMLGPMLIVLLLGVAYDHWGRHPVAQAMLRGVAATGAGLLFAMAWRMGLALKERWFFLPFTLLTVGLLVFLHWSMPLVMLVGLLGATAVAYWRLGKEQ